MAQCLNDAPHALAVLAGMTGGELTVTMCSSLG